MAGDTINAGGGRGFPWRIAGWGTAAFILLLPLVANAPWTLFDFVLMGALLGGVGLGLELAARKGNVAYRIGAALALAAAFLLVWINGAVGIIGSEREDANLLFGGVLAVALIGAIAVRGRPAGMARAMTAAAVAQLLVPVIGSTLTAKVWEPEVLGLTGVFAAIWLLSAALFRKAAA
jgi:hypothetical protein